MYNVTFPKEYRTYPRQTSGIVALDNINLETIQAYIDKQALFLFGKLCRANTSFYVKRVFIGRLAMYKYECTLNRKCTLSSLYNMLRLLSKYDMYDVLNAYIATSTVPPKHIFKRLINSSISAYESCQAGWTSADMLILVRRMWVDCGHCVKYIVIMFMTLLKLLDLHHVN